MPLGIACLKTMVAQLRFNICKLEDSRIAIENINGLPSRIKENINFRPLAAWFSPLVGPSLLQRKPGLVNVVPRIIIDRGI